MNAALKAMILDPDDDTALLNFRASIGDRANELFDEHFATLDDPDLRNRYSELIQQLALAWVVMRDSPALRVSHRDLYYAARDAATLRDELITKEVCRILEYPA